MRGGANIIVESAQHKLGGFDAAPNNRPALEHQAAITRFCEIGGSDQAVVPAACDDDIEMIFLGSLLRSGEWRNRERRQRRRLYEVASRDFAHEVASVARAHYAFFLTTSSMLVPKSLRMTIAAFL